MAASNEVLRFPTARRAAYRNPVVQIADLPANAVALRSRHAPTPYTEEPEVSRGPLKTPELALMISLFHALATGSKGEKLLFNNAARKVATMRAADMSDPALNGACDLLDNIRAMAALRQMSSSPEGRPS